MSNRKEILLFTDEKNKNILDDFVSRNGGADYYKVSCLPGRYSVEKLLTNLPPNWFAEKDEIIFDLRLKTDEDQSFCKYLEALLGFLDSTRITIICPGLERANPMFNQLLSIGIYNIVIATELHDIINQLEECVSEKGLSLFKVNVREISLNKTSGESYIYKDNVINIALLSTDRRMGATYFGLSLLNYINMTQGKTIFTDYKENEYSSIYSLYQTHYGDCCSINDNINSNFIKDNILVSKGFNEYDFNQNFNIVNFQSEWESELIEQIINSFDVIIVFGELRDFQADKTIKLFERFKYFENKLYFVPVFEQKDDIQIYSDIYERHNLFVLRPVMQDSIFDFRKNRDLFHRIIEEFIKCKK